MNAALTLAFAGSLLLAAPALAEEIAAAPPQQSSDDLAAKKDTYVKAMNDRLADWGRTFNQYSKDAVARGDEVGKAADKDLREAWEQAKDAPRRVAHATKVGWNRAAAAFDRASVTLKQDWARQTGH